MSYVAKILTAADADSVEAALWYDARLPGLGAEFLEEVKIATERLANDPEIHRIRFADIRRALVRRFKFYGLYFLIREREVWVMAIHHGRRHPGWLRMRRRRLG